MRQFYATILLIASVFLPLQSVNASMVLHRSPDSVSAADTQFYQHQARAHDAGEESSGSLEPAEPIEESAPLPPLSRDEICEMIERAASEEALPLEFFSRLIWQESRFDPFAVSPVGAQGIAQFMPRTANGRGLSNPFDTLSALFESAEYLGELRRQFGNLGLAAAAYNAGPKRVQDWLSRRNGLSSETRNYVRLITGHSVESWTGTEPPSADEVAAEGFRCNEVHKAAAQRHRHLLAELAATIRAARAEQAAKAAAEKAEAARASRKDARGAKVADRAAGRKAVRDAKRDAKGTTSAKRHHEHAKPLMLASRASRSRHAERTGNAAANAGKVAGKSARAEKVARADKKNSARRLRVAENARESGDRRCSSGKSGRKSCREA
jgi:hypothetical protein